MNKFERKMMENESPPAIEPISEIIELNALREKVLRGEEVPPEDYLRVLTHVRKLRRSKGEPVVKPEKRQKFDAASLLSGLGKPKQ